MAAQLQDSIEKLSTMFLNKMSQFELELKSNSSSSTAYITVEFTAFRAFVTQSLKCLHQQVELLAHSVDRLEMQDRRKMLLLHGVAETKSEDVAQVTANIIKNNLQLDSFTIKDIKHCHRMGRPLAPHKHRPILIKFHEVSIRDQVWFTKTKLKDSSITISEFLTKCRHDVFMAAREKFGVTRCWTKEGHVHIIGMDGERHRVVSLDDITKIASSNSQDATKQTN